ncbi:MAG: NADH:ubiquinone oxidoreductase subunit NDUFA12 [Rhodospirillales bacterium]|nr:NADH:ubiquinone oxidoreductase subunit NDUFA12 [Rhodospirillales bacterium]
MTIGTRLYTWLRGQEVGRDEFGNRYYKDKTGVLRARREKRWVVYEGDAEATKVPPDWHAWLHHLIAAPPPAGGLPTRKAWQLPHQPNQTGTPNAYRPPGHEFQGGQRAKATGDYEPWTPN